MTNTLEVDGVFLEFNSKKVLQNVYLKCETRKITGILGRNGTGKSCLMKILFGELEANSKSIRINGKPIIGRYRSPCDMRYLHQDSFIPDSLTIKRIFKDFELDFSKFINHFPDFEKYYQSKRGSLSEGELRIVEIYLILVSKAKFCMLDEPFSHIMPIHVESIKKLISEEKVNKGIIITDHLYTHITHLCDSIYLIRDGKTHLTKSIRDLETLGYARVGSD